MGVYACCSRVDLPSKCASKSKSVLMPQYSLLVLIILLLYRSPFFVRGERGAMSEGWAFLGSTFLFFYDSGLIIVERFSYTLILLMIS